MENTTTDYHNTVLYVMCCNDHLYSWLNLLNTQYHSLCCRGEGKIQADRELMIYLGDRSHT